MTSCGQKRHCILLWGKLLCVCAGLSADWYPNLDWLKESCRIAGSYNWADVDLSPFQGLKESMRQAELNNWSLDPAQIADLCSSINQFFTRTGVIPPQGPLQPQPPPSACHGPMHTSKPSQHINTGNPYMDSRQNMSSMMGPPGYPHMTPMSTAGSTMTGTNANYSPPRVCVCVCVCVISGVEMLFPTFTTWGGLDPVAQGRIKTQGQVGWRLI
ncbi:unnamed protein product [Oncorhynchus mykiss]|uniref:Uncharacterized protein n=1 Tax=Oncorhynchus mykiss TaxID=8022 RepID=A0A060WHL9_ONCMY|nr:unnamed protein product [Oncorhynchus mykiss]